ncbi:ATP-binding protein [Actinoplanes sp. CA-030573]|uniref:ATP-binding protein n=1 Tax=Actinoplanes sp. CA-030573 TaxID=3239898 RepID=UPI003D8B51B9
MSGPGERLVAQLAQIKELSGLSLRALAKEAGLSSSSLSRYLTGRLVPPWEAVVALCRAVRRDPRPLRAVWAEASRAGPAAPPRRNDLPADLIDFTGREAEAARVEQLLRSAGAATVDGMAGVGKTSLALHVAHRLADAYPDGGLYLDLHGFTPGHVPLTPAAALAQLLTGLDVERPPAGEVERAARWRSELSRRRVLVVLDNAADAGQVRPLLPGAGTSAVLVTSRNRLVGLESVPPVSLEPLTDGDAALLFGRAAGLALDADDAVGRVLRECGGLPLALRMAGARLRHRPGWTVAVLAERLRDNAGRFDAVFGMSLQQLDAGHRRLFRLLGLLPGDDFDAGVAAALAGLTPGRAEAALEELVDAHLVRETSPGRYRLHDLLRRYASELAADEEPRPGDAVRRVLAHYLERAAATGDPAWFDLEYGNLVAAFDTAVRLGADEVVAGLPPAMRVWFFRHRGTDDQVRMLAAAAEAAGRLGRDRAALLADLGFAHAAAGRLDEARAAYSEAAGLDPGDEVAAGLALRTGWVCRDLGDLPAARAHFRRAAGLFERLGQDGGRSQALAFDGWVTLRLGDRAEAVALARASLALAEGPARVTGLVTLGLALATAPSPADSNDASALNDLDEAPAPAPDDLDEAPALDDLDEALRVLHEALSVAERHDLRHNRAWCHNSLGVALRTGGRIEEALEQHRLALELLEPLAEAQLEADCRREYAATLALRGDGT